MSVTSAHNVCILVADDDDLVLATLSSGLRDMGYEVLEASTGEEAVEICERERPDIAILDIRMPGLSGIEAAQKITASSQVPFLFLSAFDDAETVQASVDSGALGYLVKPVEVNQLVPSIEAALRRAYELRTLQSQREHLTTALSTGRETNVAIGLIMAESGFSVDQAEEALRIYARSQRRKMNDIASELIASRQVYTHLLQEIRLIAEKKIHSI